MLIVLNVAELLVTFVSFTKPPLDNPTNQVFVANGEALKAVGLAVSAAFVKVPLEFEATLILKIALLVAVDLLDNNLFASLS